MNRFIYYLTMFRSKRVIIQEYGKEFWCGFKDTSDKLFKLVLKDTPDIGKSVFSFNYEYAPSYVAWYKAMRKQGLSAEQADDLMWKMNEGMLPGICNVDYMISYYMGNGFKRTKTLGYGDSCCDCHYELTGKCPIRPMGYLK